MTEQDKNLFPIEGRDQRRGQAPLIMELSESGLHRCELVCIEAVGGRPD